MDDITDVRDLPNGKTVKREFISFASERFELGEE